MIACVSFHIFELCAAILNIYCWCGRYQAGRTGLSSTSTQRMHTARVLFWKGLIADSAQVLDSLSCLCRCRTPAGPACLISTAPTIDIQNGRVSAHCRGPIANSSEIWKDTQSFVQHRRKVSNKRKQRAKHEQAPSTCTQNTPCHSDFCCSTRGR